MIYPNDLNIPQKHKRKRDVVTNKDKELEHS